MKKNDKGMGELLELLKTHPEIMSALVFHPMSIKRLLKSKAARLLVAGVDTKAFLRHVAEPENGGPVAACSRRTAAVCKGTRHELRCAGGTDPTRGPGLPAKGRRRKRAVG